jgi:cation diffusion facilitator family transporter
MDQKRIDSDQEKKTAAFTSVIAAVGLTSFKIVVGVMTGSLGILAEAAHSALDLVAAFVTLLAVRASGKPADAEHSYGHGKIENLSALFETFLLLVTCIWIINEAIKRLFFDNIHVEVSIWSFIVMGVSIIVDFNRSGMLYKVAKKHNSQALEADALHFRTDIWSSAVVIVGLVLVWIGEQYFQLSNLHKADSIAALGVAAIVIYVSFELGMRTVHALLDTAPKGAADRIKKIVEDTPGVANCHQVRVRPSGAEIFVDVHVLMDGQLSLDAAHSMTDAIELAIQGILPGCDVTIHPEPVEKDMSLSVS